MSILRLLNAQGITGVAVSLCLALLLIIQKAETGHWKKQSAQFEQLYTQQQSALAATVANYRAAGATAEAADAAAIKQTQSEQQSISQRSDNALQSRLADARARAASLTERLRGQTAANPADSRPGAAAPVPVLPATPRGADQAPGEDRLPAPDALTATEQAIQLDELIKWVRAQSKVDPNAANPAPVDSQRP